MKKKKSAITIEEELYNNFMQHIKLKKLNKSEVIESLIKKYLVEKILNSE